MESHEIYQSILADCKKVGNEVTLVAVSKRQDISKIKALYDLGQRDFGENYVQECLEKNEALMALGCLDIRWHFLGHLQKNKVKKIAEVAFCIHSIDSSELALQIEKVCALTGKQMRAYLEVNIDEEASKTGVLPESAIGLSVFIKENCPHLEILGIMVIPTSAKDSRDAFKRALVLNHQLGYQKISMGMSSDYKIAIEEGSTCVRIGTLLFGVRAD